MQTRTTLKYLRWDTSKYDINEIKTYLTEDELEFQYNGAMEVANNRNVPDGYDWDIFSRICSAVESDEGEFIDSYSLIVRNKIE